ncbi:hypothetical protein [Paenibacillus tepidiphilus]|nr:hypothetical protein [Paenibacillus tepidiphilus]
MNGLKAGNMVKEKQIPCFQVTKGQLAKKQFFRINSRFHNL